MRRFLSPTTLILATWLATLVSCSSVSVTNKPATWHKTLIGVPQTSSPASSPILHHLPLRDGKVLGYLLTSTTKNILAALDPIGGSVVWRHILDDDDYLEEFRANHDGIMALSGYDVQNVRLLEVKTGNVIWETQLQAPNLDRLPEFRCIGSCIVFASDETPDLFVSSNTGSIHRLNGLTGATKWTWTPVDNAPLTPLSKMIATPTTVFLVHFVKSTSSYKIHVTAIDSLSGEQVFTRALPAGILDPSADAIFVGNPRKDEATLVWAQQEGARFLRLSTLKEGRSAQTLAEYKKVVDVRLGPYGIFVALKADGSSSVMRLDPEHSQWITVDWSFSDSASAPSRSPSIFTGGFDKQGRPYLSRTFWSGYFKACSMELYVPHQKTIKGFYYSFDTIQNGVMLHTAMDVASSQETDFVPRFVITTSTGSFQMWQKDRKLWLREEALAHIASAVYVKLPHLAGQNAIVSNPVARFSSQLGELATDGSSLVYHFHPPSGASLGSVKSKGFASPQYQFSDSVVDAAVVGNHPARLVMIDDHHNIHTYPPTTSQQKLESASHMTFIFPSKSQVAGYRLSESGRSGSSSPLSTQQTWSMFFGGDEFIHDVIKPRSQYPTVIPTAAGNETVAYNPSTRNLVGIIASKKGSTELVNCVVRVVDGTKGSLVYSAELGPGRCEEVNAVFIGDTFVYSHQDTVASSDSAKGFRITAIDLGTEPGAKSQTQIQQRTFAVGFEPKFLAATHTKYGIALQDLIAPQSAQGPPSASVVQDEPRITISQIWQ
ncbi:hypothetical protein M407DRAFT_11722, partial [Tulasnella calospora MUT 4182]